jgi:hypothetical protein
MGINTKPESITASRRRLTAWTKAHKEEHRAMVSQSNVARAEERLPYFPRHSSYLKKLIWFQTTFLTRARQAPEGSPAEMEWLKLAFTAVVKQQKESPTQLSDLMYRDFLAAQVAKREREAAAAGAEADAAAAGGANLPALVTDDGDDDES